MLNDKFDVKTLYYLNNNSGYVFDKYYYFLDVISNSYFEYQ
jgi:hypothetical protein